MLSLAAFALLIPAQEAPAPALRPVEPVRPPGAAEPVAPAPPAAPRWAIAQEPADAPPAPAPAQERAFLGVTLDDRQGGVTVLSTVDEGPARAAGLREGDVILYFDGALVGSYARLLELLAERSPGDAVEVGLLRDGSLQEFEVTLGERPRGAGAPAAPPKPAPPSRLAPPPMPEWFGDPDRGGGNPFSEGFDFDSFGFEGLDLQGLDLQGFDEEAFEEELEAWAEQFEAQMEVWAERFEAEVESLREQFEEGGAKAFEGLRLSPGTKLRLLQPQGAPERLSPHDGEGGVRVFGLPEDLESGDWEVEEFEDGTRVYRLHREEPGRREVRVEVRRRVPHAGDHADEHEADELHVGLERAHEAREDRRREVERARADALREADRARQEADRVRRQAEREAQRAQERALREVDRVRRDAERGQPERELERARAESDALRAEIESMRSELEQLRRELETLRSDG